MSENWKIKVDTGNSYNNCLIQLYRRIESFISLLQLIILIDSNSNHYFLIISNSNLGTELHSFLV